MSKEASGDSLVPLFERVMTKLSQQPSPATAPGLTQAFYTLKDLIERWQVSRATIYREIDRGRLKRRHIGGKVRFAAGDVAAYEGQKL